jgi:hypothetical protein
MRRHELIAAFLRVEATIGLLARCRPLNFRQEAAQLAVDWQAGRKRNPEWQYARVDGIGGVRSVLHELELHTRGEPYAELWRSRCEELELELGLVEAIGRPQFVQLSERRFRDVTWASAAFALAEQWVAQAPNSEAPNELTDSPAATSLLSQMRRAIALERLPFVVQSSDRLYSAAATGEGVIWVAAGSDLFSEEVPRIVVHEVFGHAWPRVRARAQVNALFAVGTGGGNDTQEGYAVWHEVATRTQTVRRRHELGLRHLAATSVWQGADWVQTVELLVERGARLGLAQTVALRAHRAGGLAREAVYLQAYCRVSSAVEQDPGLLVWLGAGRLNLDAIVKLRTAGYHPERDVTHALGGANSATTGM